MTRINPVHVDFFEGRLILAALAFLGLLSTFKKDLNIRTLRLWLNSVTLGYLFLYLYLLHLNNWSVFHRWSYFVVASIVCSAALTWKEYVANTIVGLATPLLFSLHTPLTSLELIHFHSANFVTILLIGYSVRLHFIYKKEVDILSSILIDQSKMKALGEMSAGLCHEVNNPLTVLTTSNEQLRRMIESNNFEKTKAMDLLDKTHRMTRRISRIVTGLKDFSSKNETDKIESVDLNEIIRTSLSHIEGHSSRYNVQIQMALPTSKITCTCEKRLIIEAILNLLNNAIEACKEEEKPLINITLSHYQNYGKITVTDNGPGVPLEFTDKIMQPFFTTKELGTGPGLGLSIALGIAQRNKGKLYLDRSISMSTFTLLLPKTIK